MGHPKLMSTQSAPRDSTRPAAHAISSGFVPASCTPKNGSSGARRISANSPLRFCLRRRATVISLMVTRAPSSTHRRRYGRFEPFVMGAMTSAPASCSAKVIALMVAACRRAQGHGARACYARSCALHVVSPPVVLLAAAASAGAGRQRAAVRRRAGHPFRLEGRQRRQDHRLARRLGARPHQGRLPPAGGVRTRLRRVAHAGRRSGPRRGVRSRPPCCPLAARAMLTDGRTLSTLLDRETAALVERRPPPPACRCWSSTA